MIIWPSFSFPEVYFSCESSWAPNVGKSSPTPWRSHLRVPPPPCLSTKTHLPHLHHYRFGSWREDRFILIRLTWPHNMQDPHIMHPMYANTGECKPNSETQNRRNTTQKASKGYCNQFQAIFVCAGSIWVHTKTIVKRAILGNFSHFVWANNTTMRHKWLNL